jgi:hypothetical protein
MRAILLALTMGVALVAGGCGGDDDGGSGEVTKEDYIAKADAFCKKQNAEAKERNQKLQEVATSAKTEKEFFEKVVPELEDGLDWAREQQEAFADIEPPAADKATVDKMNDTNADALAKLEEATDAARDKDLDKFTQLANEESSIDDRANEMAKDYGFKECGSSNNEAEPTS